MNPLPIESPLKALGLGVIFFMQPALLDILPMYCLFLLITPFVINRFKNKHGSWWVLAGSFLVWSLATYTLWDSVERIGEQFLPCNFGFFNPFAWQFLFVGGLFFGFRRTAAKAFPIRKSLFIVSLLISIGIMLIRYKVFPSNLLGFDWDSVTIRETFGPLRAIDFAALAYLVTFIGVRCPKLVEWSFFSYLGQHSLQVFSFHVGLIYLVRPLYNLLIPNGWTVILIFNIVFVSMLAIPAWLHVKYREFNGVKKSL
jgi:hypothetical protein